MANDDISFASHDSELALAEEEKIEPTVEISINSIKNINRDESMLIKFKIEHRGDTLGESTIMMTNFSMPYISELDGINFKVCLPYCANDFRSVGPIISTPVLITVFEVIEEGAPPPKKHGRRKSKNNHELNLQLPSKFELKVLGFCNIDLLPLVLGEKSYKENLVLESPFITWDSRFVPWAKLPRISVTVSQDESEMMMKDLDFNIMNVTVESIYNLPHAFTKNMEYKCGTVVFKNDVKDSCIVFEDGKWTDHHDLERMKAWKSLYNLNSRARFSKSKIDNNYECVKNDFKKQFNLKEINRRDEPRIEWNVMDRILLEKSDVQNIKDHLIKYKYWPFEIAVKEKRTEENEEEESTDEAIFQCYVEASQLLFPGRHNARVLTQLFTQSSSDMEEKTGLKSGIFSRKIVDELQFERDSLVQDNLAPVLSDWNPKIESTPVLGDNGLPVLILIELELHKPLNAARTLEEYTQAIEDLKKTTRQEAPFYYYTPDNVHEQYINCIQHLVDVVDQSYRDFVSKCEYQEKVGVCPDKNNNPCQLISSSFKEDSTCPYVYIPDELSRFKQFLHETGKYVSIRSTLKSKIINLLDQKFAINSPDCFTVKNQNFVATCYTYLMEQMHVALNSKIDVRSAEVSVERESFRNLWIRAEEALELEEYDKADKLFVKIICDNRNNPDSWVVYATYHKRRDNIYEAIECCKHAIKLNSSHKIALLLYGMLLESKGEYHTAEIFLLAVTQLYPRFAEGWAILYLFYEKIEYYPGIDPTRSFAEECWKDPNRDRETMSILNEEPIAWSTSLCEKDRIFLSTTRLLLKLNLKRFVALALSADMRLNGETIAYRYFMGVHEYFETSYSLAIKLLEEVDSLIGLEYCVAALLGHAYHKIGNIDKAMCHYQSVDMMYERPENIHMVHLRLGYHLIDIKEYERARIVFLAACKHSRTCAIWLGVGICGYYLKKFEECEAALMEASRIDFEDAKVWCYLCLMSMALQRHDEFTQCYRQMVKNGLESETLWQLVRESMEKFGYAAPVTLLE